jgi:hypothetical protein
VVTSHNPSLHEPGRAKPRHQATSLNRNEPTQSNPAQSRRANIENPNRGLKYSEAMAPSKDAHSMPAWKRLAVQDQQKEAQKQKLLEEQKQQQFKQQQLKQQPTQGGQAAAAPVDQPPTMQADDSPVSPGTPAASVTSHSEDFYDDGSDAGTQKAAGGGSSGGEGAAGDDEEAEVTNLDDDSVHQLAGDVRRASDRVEQVTSEWNKAVAVSGCILGGKGYQIVGEGRGEGARSIPDRSPCLPTCHSPPSCVQRPTRPRRCCGSAGRS